MRDSGYPTTQTEFIDWYGRLDEPNALDTYYKAFGAITPPATAAIPILPFVGDTEYPDDFAPIPDELLVVMKEHLAKNEEAISLLHKAASIPNCTFPVTDQSAGTMLFKIDDWPHVRSGIDLLRLDAVVSAENRDAQRAIASIRAGIALARAYMKRPTTSDFIWGDTMLNSAVTPLNRVLYQLEEVDLTPLEEPLRESDYDGLLERALIGDLFNQVRARDYAPTLFDGRAWSLEDATLGERIRYNPLTARAEYVLGLSKIDQIQLLDFGLLLTHIASLPNAERKRELETAASRTPLAPLMIQTFSTAFDIEYGGKARIRILNTVLAIERYARATKQLPAGLHELVPGFTNAVPLDPFDELPLKYRLTDTGYVLYSVGRDMEDDGGDGQSMLLEGDVVFRRNMTRPLDRTPNQPLDIPQS
ncbi:MAG: hypothetical protein K1Y02_09860 [Candidatus Hydrogenedentes bacterium]|nr:hypothetical protein [Candidatus Hydrogenedentota bacterium]